MPNFCRTGSNSSPHEGQFPTLNSLVGDAPPAGQHQQPNGAAPPCFKNHQQINLTACGFPAPGSSDTLTLVASQTLTQAPDFQFVPTRYSGVETLRAPVTALVAPRSSSVSDYVDSTTCRVTQRPASKTPTRPRYPRH